MKTTYAQLGSISTGSNLHSDTIPAFISCLEQLIKEDCKQPTPDADRNERTEEVAETAQARIDAGEAYADACDLNEENPYWESDTANNDFDALCDALEEFAPPYATFGAHPGDGADYGFWFADDMEGIKDQIIDDGGLVVDGDMGSVPGDFEGEVLVISDHGNAALYVWDGKGGCGAVWAVV